MYEAERGLFDLRRGRPLFVTTPGAPRLAALLATVEGAGRQTLDQLRRVGRASGAAAGSGHLRLALTGHRARALGLAIDGLPHVSVGVNGESGLELMQLSSSNGTVATERFDVREASLPEVGGLTLARLGRLLPAVVSVAADPATMPELRALLDSGAVLAATTAQIEAMAASARMELVQVSDGPVPLAEAEDARFVLFREANGLLEHVAIVIGNPETRPDPLPVRIHSACLTGDLFGSLRCDCGEQLHGSLSVFAARGGGVLVYLAQEGRGIGFGNKLRAYLLQEEGLDTVQADGVLGFGADERRYDAAIQILRHLGIGRVELLTNNPEKVRAVQEAGIEVAGRLPLYGRVNPHNLRYVTSKVRAGHWLEDMLSQAGAATSSTPAGLGSGAATPPADPRAGSVPGAPEETPSHRG
jgi:GTP cyclohydrolase II